MRSDVKIEAGKWHAIAIERSMKSGQLIVDNSTAIKGKSPGSTRGLNIRSAIFFGGINRNLSKS